VRQSAPGMMRFMNSSNNGTVTAVSPWLRSSAGLTNAVRAAGWGNAPNLGIIEQALCVRLGVAGSPTQLRQASANDAKREFLLAAAVQGTDKGCQLGLGHVSTALTEALSRAVAAYGREFFLDGVASDFIALRDDPRAWAEEQAERAAWDTGPGSRTDERGTPRPEGGLGTPSYVTGEQTRTISTRPSTGEAARCRLAGNLGTTWASVLTRPAVLEPA
jgi:hypothetical protein